MSYLAEIASILSQTAGTELDSSPVVNDIGRNRSLDFNSLWEILKSFIEKKGKQIWILSPETDEGVDAEKECNFFLSHFTKMCTGQVWLWILIESYQKDHLLWLFSYDYPVWIPQILLVHCPGTFQCKVNGSRLFTEQLFFIHKLTRVCVFMFVWLYLCMCEKSCSANCRFDKQSVNQTVTMGYQWRWRDIARDRDFLVYLNLKTWTVSAVTLLNYFPTDAKTSLFSLKSAILSSS